MMKQEETTVFRAARLLVARGKQVTTKELAALVGLSETKTFPIIKALVKRELLEDDEDGTYRLPQWQDNQYCAARKRDCLPSYR